MGVVKSSGSAGTDPVPELSLRTDIGLVRMSLPDGEILDRLILPDEALPMGAPSWIPGGPVSVIYVGGDGRIYRVDFARSGLDGDLEGEANPHPTALRLAAAFTRRRRRSIPGPDVAG